MKVLLVEPDYINRFAPMGLMKISSYHKGRGDDVKMVKGRKRLYDKQGTLVNYDIIYITTLFTYEYKVTINTILFYKKNYKKSEIKVGGVFASIMPDYIEKHTGIKPYIGLWDEVEGQQLDYEIVKETHPIIRGYNERDTSIVFTSRGCSRRCKFCVVPKIEGPLSHIEDWEKNVDLSRNTISFFDNNWFAKKDEDWLDDIKKIRNLMKKGIRFIDFNQALDARLFDEERAKEMKGLPLEPVRFAFDGKQEDGHVQKAIQIARKYGFMHKPQNNRDWNSKLSNSSIFMLYNFQDKPEYFYYRAREICKNGASVMPLRYMPIDSVKKDYIGPNWTDTMLKNIANISTILFSKFKLIIPKDQEEFELAFGKDEDEFMSLIRSKNARDIAFDKHKKRQLGKIRAAEESAA